MKILYVTQYFSSDPAHASAVTTHEIVKRLAQRGHSITVASARSPGTIRVYEGNTRDYRTIDVLPLPEFGGKWYDGFATFFTLTLAHAPLVIETLLVNQFHENFDAIISMFHPTHMATVSAYLLSRILKLPLVVKIHDFVVEAMEPQTLRRIYNVVVGKINFRVLKRSSSILVQSQELIILMKKLGEIDENRMTVFPNGVDTNLFKPRIECEQLRRELGLEGDTVLMFLGGLYRSRHPELLIKALPEIIHETKHLKLLFVGEGPEKPNLLSLAAHLGVSEHVKFAGSVKHMIVPKFISLADVAVGPLSLTFDPAAYGSTPLKVLEYMACEKPIVLCRKQVSQSLIVDGYNGITVEPGDIHGLSSAVVNLIDDQHFARRIGRNARRQVKKLCSWDVLIPKLESSLNSLVESAG